MANLHVFSFNQHWFHLGSAVENILAKQEEYSSIHLHLFQQNLRTLPVDMHFRFPGSRFSKNSPELIAAKYLKEKLGNKFTFSTIKLDTQITISFPEVHSISELKLIKSGEVAIGMAISSHLISLTRNSNPKIREYRNLIQRCQQFYADIDVWFKSQMFEASGDEIWICNGRTFHERVVAEIAKKNRIATKYYEIGGEGLVPNRWILHDESPHNRDQHQKAIEKHFESSTPNYREIENWFLSHEDPNINSFASLNSAANKNLNMKEKPFIVFFSSSDDEVAAISAEWDSPWGSQLKAVSELIRLFSSQDIFNLVIRVHPNQGNKSKQDRKSWNNLQSSENVQIFKYSDRVNSYELMENSRGVLTHGSTMGVEAAFRRKRQAFLSPTRFDQIIPEPKLSNLESLTKWLKDLESTPPEPNDAAYIGSLKWAHYMLSAGSKWNSVRIGTRYNRKSGYLGNQGLRPISPWVALTRIYVFFYRNFIERRLESARIF